MLKSFKRAALFTAWAILFVHSIVPHAHEVKEQLAVCATEHQHNQDLLDLLGHIFHFSTGEEHLEDFSNSGNTLLCFIPAETSLAIPLFVAAEQRFSPLLNPLATPLVRLRSLRAPPVYS